MPLLTIVIHVYNIEEYLPRCINNILEQTFADFKVLLIDDDSTDNTFKICQEASARDKRIIAMRSEHMGLAQQRNRMLQYVDTEFMVSMDGDDYVKPDYLKHLVDAQRKYDADIVISRVAYVPEDGSRIDGSFPERGEQCYRGQAMIDAAIPTMLVDRRLNYLYGKIYRTNLWEGVKVDDDVRTGSDTMMNIQLVTKAKSVVLIDDCDYFYVKYNTRSVTSYKGSDVFERLKRINGFVADYAEKIGRMTPDLRRAVDERILLGAHWAITPIMEMDIPSKEKARLINDILTSPTYREAFDRQGHRKDQLWFELIPESSGASYMRRVNRQRNITKAKSRILNCLPKKVVNIYHNRKYGHTAN